MREAGILGQQLRFGHARCQQIEDQRNPDAGPLDAGFSTAYSRIDRDALQLRVHPAPWISVTLLYRKWRGCGLISQSLIDPERRNAQLQSQERTEIRSEKACRAGARPGRRGR